MTRTGSTAHSENNIANKYKAQTVWPALVLFYFIGNCCNRKVMPTRIANEFADRHTHILAKLAAGPTFFMVLVGKRVGKP